jgi:predicted RNA-binding Zn-ribbon protein involved in translation (DUF1610 family)
MKAESKHQETKLAENSTAGPSINQTPFPRLDCGNNKQELEFTCPRCGGRRIVKHFEDYGRIWMHEDGQVVGGLGVEKLRDAEFVCWDCGDPICNDQGEPIRSRDDLVRHLKRKRIDPADYLDPERSTLHFCCPECGGEQLEEVFATAFDMYFTEDGDMRCGEDFCYSFHFRCHACRWIVEDQDEPIEHYEQLATWLKANRDQNPDE